MKICKSCSAAMDDDAKFCGICGAAVTEDEVSEEPAAEPVAEVAAEATKSAKKASKRKTRIGLIIGLVAAVLVVVGVIIGKGQYDQSRGEPLEAAYHTNAYGYDSYSIHYETDTDDKTTYSYMTADGELVTVRPKDVKALLDEVVAECGEMKLDNRYLQYYYNQAYYAFYNQNSSYISYFMDLNKGLDEQLDLDEAATWQDYFMDYAVKLFQEMATLYQAAEEAGYTLSEAEEAALEENLDLAALAEAYGFDSVEEMIQMRIGPGATEETYRDFSRVCTVAQSYGQYLMTQIEVTEQDKHDYYDANADMMRNTYGVEKIEKNVVNVRHILISPAQTTDDNGKTSITDESWKEAEVEAQRILDDWIAGGKSEEDFAEAANTHSTDGGSNTNGGLYENVVPGQMVQTFNDWCFEDGRKAGDYGIVKTNYGYHIMYFVGEGDYQYWALAAEQLFRQEEAAADRAEMVAALNPTVDLTKAMILDSAVPSVPTAETETETSTE